MLQVARRLPSSTHRLSGSILLQVKHARAGNEDETPRQKAKEGQA